MLSDTWPIKGHCSDGGWTSGTGAQVCFDLADGLNEGREKSKVTPGFWLEQLDGCWHFLQVRSNWKGADFKEKLNSTPTMVNLRCLLVTLQSHMFSTKKIIHSFN